MKSIITTLCVVVLLTGCATSKKYTAVDQKTEILETELEELRRSRTTDIKQVSSGFQQTKRDLSEMWNDIQSFSAETKDLKTVVREQINLIRDLEKQVLNLQAAQDLHKYQLSNLDRQLIKSEEERDHLYLNDQKLGKVQEAQIKLDIFKIEEKALEK